MKATRRTFLGGLAATAVPVTAATASIAMQETQEKKCIRLTKELLAEFSKLPFHGESLGGPVLDLRNGADIDCLRYARKDNGESMLVVMIDMAEAQP